MPQRFLVVDDHPLMRDAIRTILDTMLEDGRVDTASSLSEAIGRLESEPSYDLALLDLRLPDAAGFEGLKTLRNRFPECPTVVMSGELDGRTILHCLELGAAGYIPKTLHGEGITNALRVVAAGDVYVPQQVVTAQAGAAHAPHDGDSSDPRALGLTGRQIDVLRLILQGLPNKLICRRLNLAEGTIKVHVSAVLRALGVRTRAQAIIAATSLGLRLGEGQTHAPSPERPSLAGSQPASR